MGRMIRKCPKGGSGIYVNPTFSAASLDFLPVPYKAYNFSLSADGALLALMGDHLDATNDYGVGFIYNDGSCGFSRPTTPTGVPFAFGSQAFGVTGSSKKNYYTLNGGGSFSVQGSTVDLCPGATFVFDNGVAILPLQNGYCEKVVFDGSSMSFSLLSVATEVDYSLGGCQNENSAIFSKGSKHYAVTEKGGTVAATNSSAPLGLGSSGMLENDTVIAISGDVAYMSTNLGASWAQVCSSVTGGIYEMFAPGKMVVVDNNLYVVMQVGEPGEGYSPGNYRYYNKIVLYRSTDLGCTWELFSTLVNWLDPADYENASTDYVGGKYPTLCAFPDGKMLFSCNNLLPKWKSNFDIPE